MLRIIQRAAHGKYILPLLVLYCGFTLYIFPKLLTRLHKLAGKKVKLLDVRFTYSREKVVADFQKLGADGRNLYAFIAGRVDMIYPLVYGCLFILILTYLLKKVTRPDSRFSLAALLPVLIMLFDYFENFNILHLLKSFPNISDKDVARGELMTRLKFGMLIVTTGVALSLTLAWMVKELKSRNDHLKWSR